MMIDISRNSELTVFTNDGANGKGFTRHDAEVTLRMESIERHTWRLRGLEGTSTGLASHFDKNKAIENGYHECIERATIALFHQDKSSFYLIEEVRPDMRLIYSDIYGFNVFLGFQKYMYKEIPIIIASSACSNTVKRALDKVYLSVEQNLCNRLQDYKNRVYSMDDIYCYAMYANKFYFNKIDEFPKRRLDSLEDKGNYTLFKAEIEDLTIPTVKVTVCIPGNDYSRITQVIK